MRLSERMEAIADMVTVGNILADVGTDHGYIPIALVTRGRIPKAIAMDLREGPLARAMEHIAQYGLGEKIDTRLSDGVAALAPGEAETIVIAGMGGELVIHILSDGEQVCKGAKELILQPQSEIAGVRAFLRNQGYRICDENMIEEDGKYYPMMRVVFGENESIQATPVEDAYGPVLLWKRHPVLLRFLKKQHSQLAKILSGLQSQPASEQIVQRMHEVEEKLQLNRQAQAIMEEEAQEG